MSKYSMDPSKHGLPTAFYTGRRVNSALSRIVLIHGAESLLHLLCQVSSFQFVRLHHTIMQSYLNPSHVTALSAHSHKHMSAFPAMTLAEALGLAKRCRSVN